MTSDLSSNVTKKGIRVNNIPVESEVVPNNTDESGFKFFLKNLHFLYFKPREFFKDLELLNSPLLINLSLWLMGMVYVVDKIDQKLMKSDYGVLSKSNQALIDLISNGWSMFFLFVAGVGAISAVFYWYIGGWFYNLRLTWSGAGEFDRKMGRIVYVFSSLVVVIPQALVVLLGALLFQNYVESYNSDEYWSATLIVFPFWSVFVSYTALSMNFNVVKWKALTLFVVLPVMIYLIAYGAIIWATMNLA